MKENREIKQLKYNKMDRIRSGLLALFPNPESYRRFFKDNREGIQPFIDLALEQGIIEKAEGFENFINENACRPEECNPPEGFTFSDLMEDREKINTSGRGLTIWVNELVERYHLQGILPAGKVNNAMFSRLKQGPANTRNKRNVLRLLSFWLGYKRPHLGRSWNYETLLKTCPEEQALDSREGTRIAVALYSRKDVIEEKAVKWLKNEIRGCLEDLGLSRLTARLQAYSTTWFYLDLPKERSATNEPSHPRSYDRCMKEAISIAHQIALRWALSTHSSPRKTLSIGIAAGEFSTLDDYLQSIIKARLPSECVIRMTDYSRLCVQINNIRVIFNETPTMAEMPAGETITIWSVKGLWNTNFWDFIPALLKDRMLQADSRFDEEFKEVISLSGDNAEGTAGLENGVIETLLRDPQNSLLGLEIAKTLYFRRRLLEANEILRIVLSTDPSNHVARALRVTIFTDLGINAETYPIAALRFTRADEEADFTKEIYKPSDEDFFCEAAVSKLGQAIAILRLIRREGGRYETGLIELDERDVYRLLDHARKLFEMGMTVSSTGGQSRYFLMCLMSLKKILKNDPDILKDQGRKILDKQDFCRETATEIYSALGWLRDDLPEANRKYTLEKRINDADRAYNDSVLLRASVPSAKYSSATMLWDFSAVLTAGVARDVIRMLKEAAELSEELKNEELSVLSFIRFHKEIMTPDRFIDHTMATIREVEQRVGKTGELESMDASSPLDLEKLGGLKLFCLHI